MAWGEAHVHSSCSAGQLLRGRPTSLPGAGRRVGEDKGAVVALPDGTGGGRADPNLPLLAASLGESERVTVRHLIELEESGLIESDRGNVNKEDVRISFPRHPLLARNASPVQTVKASPTAQAVKEVQPRLFAVESAIQQTTAEAAPDAARSLLRRQERRRGSAGLDARARAIHSRHASSSSPTKGMSWGDAASTTRMVRRSRYTTPAVRMTRSQIGSTSRLTPHKRGTVTRRMPNLAVRKTPLRLRLAHPFRRCARCGRMRAVRAYILLCLSRNQH